MSSFETEWVELDLITPASKWAAEETLNARADAHDPASPSLEHRMPPAQQMVMFLSVVGPFAGLLAAIALFWRRDTAAGGIGWTEIIVMIAMYALAGFGVTIGFHRLLTHKAFQTHRWIKLMLAILGSSAGQGMCIRWCATHRRHHQRSDREGDPHSPHLHGAGPRGLLRGMWHAHVAWCFDKDCEATARSVPDLLADRALLRIDQLYFLWVALGILVPAVLLGVMSHSWSGFFSGMIWGGFVRIFLLQHVTWSINSVCHVWGARPFHSADHSRNNFPIAIVSLGEGWHNNHHAFPTSARHGLRWWQFDSSYLLIRAMGMMGLAWDIIVPADSAQRARKRKT